MTKLLLLIGLLMSSSMSLSAEKLDEVTWDSPRVNQFLPNLVSVPSLDFALPEDYVCVPSKNIQRCKQMNYWDGYFWGPKEVIEEAFENSTIHVIAEINPKKPILEAQISLNVAQIGDDEFSIEREIKNRPGITYKKFRWGPYPVIAVNTKSGKNINNPSKTEGLNVAYVGLNNASHVLKISIFPPKDSKEETLELWETFLNQTKPLGLLEESKSKGQELKVGTTVVNLVGSYLKVIAEQRNSDGEVQIAIIPCSEGITFESQNIYSVSCLKTSLGAEFDGTLIKMSGKLITDGPAVKHNVESQQTINVVLKEVDAFSLNKKDWASKNNVQFFDSKDIKEPSLDSVDLNTSAPSLAGKIEAGLYYAPSGKFICKAEDFGEGKHMISEHFSDSRSSVSFFDKQHNCIQTDILGISNTDRLLPEKLQKTTKEYATLIMVKEAGAQGLEVVHEEITGQKLAFSIFSVDKFDEPKDALGHSEPCTVGCLVFQHENKMAALSIQRSTPYGEKHVPKKHIKAIKEELLAYYESLSFPTPDEL